MLGRGEQVEFDVLFFGKMRGNWGFDFVEIVKTVGRGRERVLYEFPKIQCHTSKV